MEELLADFIEKFHKADGIDEKLKVLANLFCELGIEQAFFISSSEICRKRHHPILNTDESYLQSLPLTVLSSEEFVTHFGFKTLNDRNFCVFTLKDSEKNYGTLFFYPLPAKSETIFRIVGEVVICGMKGCELKEMFINRTNQIETFRKLSEKISSYYNLEDLLKMLTENVTFSLNAKGTVIRLVNKDKKQLEVMAEYGLEDVHIRRHGVDKGNGISGEVWESGVSRLVLPDTEESIKLLKSKLNVSSLICVPLTFEKEIIGTLSVYERLGDRTFNEDDKEFLEVLGSLVAPVIAYTTTIEREKKLLEKLEKHLKDLTLITEINRVLMEPRKLDSLLYILLTTLTFGEEIGFNRAVLFMYNAKTGTLQGMMGIGCETVDEAYQVWQILPKDVTAITWIERIKELEPLGDTTFNQKVKRLRFFVDEVNVFSQAFKTGRVYVERNKDDSLIQIFGVSEYAVIPLCGKEGVLGMLYVDNKFTHKSIDEDYIKLLETFASQASIAIENARLYNELKETNDMLKMARQELLIKEKLAVVGEMLTTLAHEVRNPLTAMGGFAKVIARRTEDSSIKELSQKIVLQAERVNKMFNDFLYLAKADTYKSGTCDIAQVIKTSLNNMAFLFSDRIKIKVDIDNELPCLAIDESVLGVVLDNIIKNAAQAMESGGEIRIKAYQDNAFITIAIEDDGHGISKEVLPHIFDPFYTTKFNGIGVGLSVSYKIIKQHNGIIYAENIAENKGARFVIKLPFERIEKENEVKGGVS